MIRASGDPPPHREEGDRHMTTQATGARRATSGGHHPVVLRLDRERYENIQLRVADRITAFAGSMRFVYLHILGFGLWMLVFEKSPWPTLTLVVSLEAIFLSTFVMIGQNRQATFQQAKADHDFTEQEQELKLNTDLTREVHALTVELHQRIVREGGATTGETPSAGG
jgi:uncharacterized membrane protein